MKKKQLYYSILYSLLKHVYDIYFLSFPGGKVDDTDRDLVHTALRESHEEIGLPDDNIDIWGQMCYIPSRVM